MKKKLLFNNRVKIGTVNLIKTASAIITTVDKPKKITSYSSSISFKDYSVLKHRSKLTGAIKELLKTQGKIVPVNIKYLLKTSSEVSLIFKINKEKYDFSKIIMDNIDDLYERIIKLYAITKRQFINKYGLEYMRDTYFLNETLFVTILNNIEAFKIRDYSEITDKLIITEIVKYFRSIN